MNQTRKRTQADKCEALWTRSTKSPAGPYKGVIKTPSLHQRQVHETTPSSCARKKERGREREESRRDREKREKPKGGRVREAERRARERERKRRDEEMRRGNNETAEERRIGKRERRKEAERRRKKNKSEQVQDHVIYSDTTKRIANSIRPIAVKKTKNKKKSPTHWGFRKGPSKHINTKKTLKNTKKNHKKVYTSNSKQTTFL